MAEINIDRRPSTKKSFSGRRIYSTADVLAPANAEQAAKFRTNRIQAVTSFHLSMKNVSDLAVAIKDRLNLHILPLKLFGTLLEPDGAPAGNVQIVVEIPEIPGSHFSTITKISGTFMLSLPRADQIIFCPNELVLKINGSNANIEYPISSDVIDSSGLIKVPILLPTKIEPLHVSIIQALQSILPDDKPTTSDKEDIITTTTEPKVILGEGEKCLTTYLQDYTVERFPLGILFRLIEPRASIEFPARQSMMEGEERFTLRGIWEDEKSFSDDAVIYVDRVPIEQPISVDGFRDRIIGLDGSEVVNPLETVPMAGTLGLGYIVQMAQSWKPKGFSLGNLVYSLPLAPGEQQKVAIFERVDVATVRENEILDVEEQQSFEQLNDASSLAVFTSAFNEMAKGGSHFDTQASSGSSDSWDLIFWSSGGSGWSSSSGNQNSWMEGARNSVQTAAENSHDSVVRQAAARRRAQRSSMRLATASESENVTTKVITNHNHAHALTFQYWEVQRLFEISTDVEGVTLVCLVPLEVVRFLPPSQPLKLNSPTLVDNGQKILDRYALLLKHIDVLAQSLPREYRHGLTLLAQFAGDPKTTVDNTTMMDVINFELFGAFLPFDEVYISAITSRGTRLGPVRLDGISSYIPVSNKDFKDAMATKEELLGFLRGARFQGIKNGDRFGSITIPPSLARNDIVGFEISRSFRGYDYDLINPLIRVASIFGGQIPAGSSLITSTIHLSPDELERELGGPLITSFNAKLASSNAENYANISTWTYLPDDMFIPANEIPPAIRYSQVLQIERTLQHVVRNTVSYSKAIWRSLTTEERVIMLEGFTIGVPADGIADASQMVPLLNCVENRVLGFYGNSMIMPFVIPPSLAESMNITSGQIQNMLTNFHRTAFEPPKSIISLPTRGVLGEAVLGSCQSAEKIDITRFWNWADAPADSAPEIASVTVPTMQPSLATGLTGPNSLTGIQPLINNFNAGGGSPSADVSLLQSMIKAASEQKDFSTDLTGASQLASLIKNTQDTAEKARADALKTTRDQIELAMATAGNILGGMKGNPTAGSSALSALNGTPSDSSKKTDATDKKTDTSNKETEGASSSQPGGSGTGSGNA